jgi:hypothetical protein
LQEGMRGGAVGSLSVCLVDFATSQRAGRLRARVCACVCGA